MSSYRFGPGVALLVLLAIGPRPLAGQETEAVPGVTLGLVYENEYVPPLAILPLDDLGGGATVATGIQAILGRDLRNSDRFAVVDSLPVGFSAQGVDYGLWDQFGADWVLTGTVAASGDGYVLEVVLHDIVFSSIKQQARFTLPPEDDGDFRMAVHRASDAVVEWVFGEPGMAATRIVFTMRPPGDESSKEVYAIDSDGENLQRLTWDANTVASPAWSPDGTRVLYSSWKSGRPTIYERDLVSDRERVLEPNRAGQQITPAYHPDGNQIAFALLGGGGSGLFSFNLADGCCLSHLSGGRYKDLQPTFSPNGRRIAFVSSRLGTGTPQIYVMPSNGGEAELLSPYRFGEGGWFADPDWSPRGDRVTFSGRIQGRRSPRYHILVADVQTGDSRLVQLTREGNNEDPSWAPDGRHIVFTGERSWGRGVFIVDSATGNLRTLIGGVSAEDTDWSPLLGQPAMAREAQGSENRDPAGS